MREGGRLGGHVREGGLGEHVRGRLGGHVKSTG